MAAGENGGMAKQAPRHAQSSRTNQRRGTSKRKITTRARTDSPLALRSWVNKLSEEEMSSELIRRIAALERGGTPFSLNLSALLHSMLQQVTSIFGQPGGDLDFPGGFDRTLARMIGANLVVAYFDQHEYQAGMFLPRITTIGAPWNIPPDAIHVLDLSVNRIEEALSPARADTPQKGVSANPSDGSWGPFELFQIQVESALAGIRQLGPAAVFDKWILLTLFICLTHARYSASDEEAKHAAFDANRLLDQFRPDLPQRMKRVPERLSDLQKRFQELHDGAVELRNTLDALGPTGPVLSRARDRFGGRVDRRDLTRWQRMTPDAIAREILALECKLTPKAVLDKLRLAKQAKSIDEAWGDFQIHLTTLPNEIRHRILLFPSEPIAEPQARAKT